MIHNVPKIFFNPQSIDLFQFDPQVVDFRKYDLECEIEQVSTIETTMQCESLVIVLSINARYKSNKCSWKAEVSLKELYLVMREIADLASAYPKLLTQVLLLLNQLKQLLNSFGIQLILESKMKPLFNQKKENTVSKGKQMTSMSMPMTMEQNENKQKMCYDLSASLNNLFLLDKREVLFSVNFRQLFSIQNIVTLQNINIDSESLNCSMNSLM